jgi:WD40 repeat protein
MRGGVLLQGDGKDGKPLHCLDAGAPPSNSSGAPATAGCSIPVLKCSFRPAGPSSANPELPLLVATCSGNPGAAVQASVAVWACDSGERLHAFDVGTRAVAGLAWSRCGRFLAAAAMDKVARVWDGDSGRQVAAVPVPEAALAVDWSLEGLLCVGMCNGIVHVVELDIDAVL